MWLCATFGLATRSVTYALRIGAGRSILTRGRRVDSPDRPSDSDRNSRRFLLVLRPVGGPRCPRLRRAGGVPARRRVAGSGGGARALSPDAQAPERRNVMIKLYDNETDADLGSITEEQLEFL